MADSTASEPELTKKTSERSPGATSAIMAAASMEGGWALPQLVAKARRPIWSAAASARSVRPWPMLTQKRPARPSSHSLPSVS